MERELRAGVYLLAILGIIFCDRPGAAQKEASERAKTFEEVKAILEQDDTFKAIEFVNGQGVPETVAKRYSGLVMDFYWQEHALSEVTIFARAGIQYSLTKAEEIAEEDSEKAVQLKGIAKAMAYNLASFMWSGWGEEDLIISQADLATGLDAAKLNLRLAIELEKGAVPLLNAYWVLGAQYLALRQYDEAMDAFVLAKEKAAEAGEGAIELMNMGYVGIVKIMEGSHKVEGEREFEEAIEGLKKSESEDARFYIDQLRTALKVFSE